MLVRAGDYRFEETGEPWPISATASSRPTPTSAPAPIVEALAGGAGRRHHRAGSADPALFLAPLVHEFGWAHGRLGPRSGAARLSATCSNAPVRSPAATSPIPGYKDVQDLARLGFPIGGGRQRTAGRRHKSSGLWRAGHARHVQGAAALRGPRPGPLLPARRGRGLLRGQDVGSSARTGSRVDGGAARRRTGSLKVSVGYVDSYVGEGQISYAGPGALARGAAGAGDRARAPRAHRRADDGDPLRPDRRRCAARRDAVAAAAEPYEVRLRVAGAHRQPRGSRARRQRGRDPLHERPGRRRRRLEVGPRSRRRASRRCVPRDRREASRSVTWRH